MLEKSWRYRVRHNGQVTEHREYANTFLIDDRDAMITYMHGIMFRDSWCSYTEHLIEIMNDDGTWEEVFSFLYSPLSRESF